MQNDGDNLDRMIATAFNDIEVQEEYNTKLIRKLHKKKSLQVNRNFVPSLSLITAGLFIILLSATNFQSKWIHLEYQLKTQAITRSFQYENTFNFIKNLGE